LWSLGFQKKVPDIPTNFHGFDDVTSVRAKDYIPYQGASSPNGISKFICIAADYSTTDQYAVRIVVFTIINKETFHDLNFGRTNAVNPRECNQCGKQRVRYVSHF
jgi:hypothetical protein